MRHQHKITQIRKFASQRKYSGRSGLRICADTSDKPTIREGRKRASRRRGLAQLISLSLTSFSFSDQEKRTLSYAHSTFEKTKGIFVNSTEWNFYLTPRFHGNIETRTQQGQIEEYDRSIDHNLSRPSVKIAESYLSESASRLSAFRISAEPRNEWKDSTPRTPPWYCLSKLHNTIQYRTVQCAHT